METPFLGPACTFHCEVVFKPQQVVDASAVPNLSQILPLAFAPASWNSWGPTIQPQQSELLDPWSSRGQGVVAVAASVWGVQKLQDLIRNPKRLASCLLALQQASCLQIFSACTVLSEKGGLGTSPAFTVHY